MMRFYFLLLLLLSRPATGAEIAILGDSLSTGAATHPALEFDAAALWRAFNGEVSLKPKLEDLPEAMRERLAPHFGAPSRLWPTSREFFGGFDWVYRHVMQLLSRVYLDTEEYSWGSMVSGGLDVSPKDVLIAAENGARIDAMPRHIDRVLAATGGVLPRRLFIFYTGNDLCGLTLAQVTSAEAYGKALARGFDYLLRNSVVPEEGTDVYLLSYLSVVQLLHGQAILDKDVRAFGGRMTCRELRQNGYRPKMDAEPPALPPEAWYFSMLLPPNPAAFCPTLFGGLGEDKEATIGALANRIRDYREREVWALTKAAAQGTRVRFRHVRETADLIFGGEDIAEDCFHLSTYGHAKVAEAVLRSISSASGE